MTTERAKEIIDRKSTIPLENESTEDINMAYDIASSVLSIFTEKPVKPRKCWNCKYDDCIGCDSNFNRCPNCNEVLDDDYGTQYKHCPDCGQKLIWL